MSGFDIHPSYEMKQLFNEKPFQGQDPKKAKIIFLSSDANYSEKVSDNEFFKYLLEYQKDSINFWKKHQCHHPFMMEEYPFNRTVDGVPFHRNFSKLALSAEHAEFISFIELLDIPTIGNKSENKKRFYELVSVEHLRNIENLMLNNNGTIFFISKGVLKDLKKFQKIYNVFSFLNLTSSPNQRFSQEINKNFVLEIYHFSSYQIHSQLEEIRMRIDNWLNCN
ncbi:hypothetical protein [Sulfuricurvum sp.]|uniref:hypothetical protein n=1 Tax=Sulfuricurvum sp. TaxID=2025608 RepID=UPI002617CB90|nr:hypothetical protein [Sulfuricurvum sp.]MDD2267361.1 hypothetical protein [Sulfuricurvum sp.]